MRTMVNNVYECVYVKFVNANCKNMFVKLMKCNCKNVKCTHQCYRVNGKDNAGIRMKKGAFFITPFFIWLQVSKLPKYWADFWVLKSTFHNQTILHPTSFRPFEFQTSLVFRSPLYIEWLFIPFSGSVGNYGLRPEPPEINFSYKVSDSAKLLKVIHAIVPWLVNNK